MAKQYQRVEPTPFDAPVSATASTAQSTDARPAWIVPALIALALVALVVVFLLPGWVDPPNNDSTTPQVAAVKPPAASTSKPAAASRDRDVDAPAASPFADAREAKARAEAQELLAELLDVQENLTQRGAEEWASEAMAAVASQALAGDEFYREREFDFAIAQYEEALDGALALERSLPTRFQAQLDATVTAIEALDVETAATSLALAKRLEPGSLETAALDARLAVLPQIVDDVSAAQQAEQTGELSDAVDSLRAAAESDGSHQFVQAELQRLQVALTQQRFNAAMSEGYAALDEKSFTTAQKRFERAAALQPGSSEASAALQELSVARTAATLNRLQNQGEKLLGQEDWSEAIRAFEEALAIDQSLRFAREGLAIARPRGQIDAALSAIVSKPERLVDDAILREAEGTLAQAQALGNLGPRLSAQLANAREVVAVASRPLPIALRSDGLTEVTVYKVARLGLFEQEQLTLRPGQYTAVGTRRGFRDVRVVFTVAPDLSDPVTIACSEPI